MPEEEGKKEESKPEPEQASPPAVPENKVVTLSRDPEPPPPENETETRGD